MLNFYSKFFKNAVLILAPLTKPSRAQANVWIGLRPWMQLSAVLKTFSPPCLSCASHPWCSCLPCSGRLRHTGGWSTPAISVQQSWSHLELFSRKLSDTKTCYSAFDCELLAAFSTIRHFSFLLEARHNLIY